jgi:hypothetical protein
MWYLAMIEFINEWLFDGTLASGIGASPVNVHGKEK